MDSSLRAKVAAWRRPSAARAWLELLATATLLGFGLALMFGVALPINFDSPYQARNMIDFWRRWHMSLSTWLRDYLYVPLGGNRRGPARRQLNLLLTMLLGGLWHGAAWTFVGWGALHGLYLVLNHAWRAWSAAPSRRWLASLAAWCAWPLTFLAAALAWVLFRAVGRYRQAWLDMTLKLAIKKK